MSARTRLHGTLLVIAALALGAHAVPSTWSTFTASTSNEGSTISASADWSAPHVTAVVAQKSQGGATGKVRQGGTFFVYAAASDTGSPPSKIATVTADVSALATTSSATLTAGTYTVGGVAYGFRSASLTARFPLAGGTYAFSVKATDTAGNIAAAVAGSVAVENTTFAGADVATLDVGGNAGLAQAGDKLTLTYNKPVEPGSIVAGWDGSARTTTVRLTDGSIYGLGGSQDLMAPVDGAGTVLPTGYVVLGGDYVSSNRTVSFATSTMTISGNAIVLKLGSPDTASNLRDDNNNRVPVWTPYAAAYDQFANPASTTAILQSGSARRQF